MPVNRRINFIVILASILVVSEVHTSNLTEEVGKVFSEGSNESQQSYKQKKQKSKRIKKQRRQTRKRTKRPPPPTSNTPILKKKQSDVETKEND